MQTTPFIKQHEAQIYPEIFHRSVLPELIREGQIPIYKQGEYNGTKFIFSKNTGYNRQFPNLLFIETGKNTFSICEFKRQSPLFEVLAEVLSSPSKSITYIGLQKILQTIDIAIDHFAHNTIYSWFSYYRTELGLPFGVVNTLGFGLEDLGNDQTLKEKLNAEWVEQVLSGEIKSTKLHLGDLEIYYPEYRVYNLPKPGYILIKDLDGTYRILDFGFQNTLRRSFRALVETGGYLDRAVLDNASKTDWWTSEQDHEKKRSSLVSAENAKTRELTIDNQDNYDHLISVLRDFLDTNNFPELISLKNEVGFVLSNTPSARRNFINQSIIDYLNPIIGKDATQKELDRLGVLANQFCLKYNLQIIFFNVADLEERTGRRMYQTTAKKLFGALFVRIPEEDSSDKKLNSFVVELSELQAGYLASCKGFAEVVVKIDQKKIDNIRRCFSKIVTEFIRCGFIPEPNTGVVYRNGYNEGHVIKLPVPSLSKSENSFET